MEGDVKNQVTGVTLSTSDCGCNGIIAPSFCCPDFPAQVGHTLELWATPFLKLLLLQWGKSLIRRRDWSRNVGLVMRCRGGGLNLSGILVSWISQNYLGFYSPPPSEFLKWLFQLVVLSTGPRPGKFFYQIHWVISCAYFRKREIAGQQNSPETDPPEHLANQVFALCSAFLAKSQQVHGCRWLESLRVKAKGDAWK